MEILEWFGTLEGGATLAFVGLVLIPLARKFAKRTPTLVDDQAVSLAERVLAFVGLARKK